VSYPFADQQKFLNSTTEYRGRFAPSPSGELHFGSLVAALASYLQAKKNKGKWFVRIEDIDKPREQTGAVEQILSGLTSFGMNWDVDELTAAPVGQNTNNCLVQSCRIKRYEKVLEYLISLNRVYACTCTRKQIKASGGIYLGECKDKGLPIEVNQNQHSLRLHLPELVNQFEDLLHGLVTQPIDTFNEDFIVKRKDQLFAYQLVVVVDDIDQGITEVVRGADIMPLTFRQISLYRLLNVPAPRYLHLPLAVNKPGFKLSKQNHAQGINQENPIPELIQALEFLGLPIHKLQSVTSVDEIISWAVQHWSVDHIPKQQEIVLS